MRFSVPGDLVVGGLLGAGTAWCMLQDTVGYALLAEAPEEALRFCQYREIALIAAVLAWFAWSGWQADRKPAGWLGRWLGLPLLAGALVVLMGIAFKPSTLQVARWADDPEGWALLIGRALLEGIPTAALLFGLVAILHQRRILRAPQLGAIGVTTIACWLVRLSILAGILGWYYYKTEFIDERWTSPYIGPDSLLTNCVVYLPLREHLAFLLSVLVPLGCLVGCTVRYLRGGSVRAWHVVAAALTPWVAMALVSHCLGIGSARFFCQAAGDCTVLGRWSYRFSDRAIRVRRCRVMTTVEASAGDRYLTEPRLMRSVAEMVNADTEGRPRAAVRSLTALLAAAGPDALLRWTAYSARQAGGTDQVRGHCAASVQGMAESIGLTADDPDYESLIRIAGVVAQPPDMGGRRTARITVDGRPGDTLVIGLGWGPRPGDDLSYMVHSPAVLLHTIGRWTTTDTEGRFELREFGPVEIHLHGNLPHARLVSTPGYASRGDVGTFVVVTH